MSPLYLYFPGNNHSQTFLIHDCLRLKWLQRRNYPANCDVVIDSSPQNTGSVTAIYETIHCHLWELFGTKLFNHEQKRIM